MCKRERHLSWEGSRQDGGPLGTLVLGVTSQLLLGIPTNCPPGLPATPRDQRGHNSQGTWVRGQPGGPSGHWAGEDPHQALPGSQTQPTLWPSPDLMSGPRDHILGKKPWGTAQGSIPVLCVLDPSGSGPTLGAWPGLRTSARTCPLYPAPTSQTKPSGPVHWRFGAASVTSPAPCGPPPGDGPEWWLAAVRMGATGAGSPEAG